MSTVIIKVRHHLSHLAPVIYSHKSGTIVLAPGCFKWGPLLEQRRVATSSWALMSSAVCVCVCVCVCVGREITLLECSQICAPTNIFLYVYILSSLADYLWSTLEQETLTWTEKFKEQHWGKFSSYLFLLCLLLAMRILNQSIDFIISNVLWYAASLNMDYLIVKEGLFWGELNHRNPCKLPVNQSFTCSPNGEIKTFFFGSLQPCEIVE